MRWQKIFGTEEQACQAVEEGGARRLVIGELRIALVRWNNQFYAIQDECPHRGAYLSQGTVNSTGDVVCPLHSYCYNLNTGREFSQLTQDARTWPLKWEDGALYIGL